MTHTVLTIEDQPDIRRLIVMTLEFKGFLVLEASDGEQGLQLARSRRPDLILLDVMMPGMGGLSAARILRADPALCRIPLILVSAMAMASEIDAGLETGASAYLTKPFSPRALLDLVARLIAAAPHSAPRPVPQGGDVR
jgi:CheY-like chemotaxis protein